MNETERKHFVEYVYWHLEFDRGSSEYIINGADNLDNIYYGYKFFSKIKGKERVSLFKFLVELLKLKGVSAELIVLDPPLPDGGEGQWCQEKLDQTITEERFKELKIERDSCFVEVSGISTKRLQPHYTPSAVAKISLRGGN